MEWLRTSGARGYAVSSDPCFFGGISGIIRASALITIHYAMEMLEFQHSNSTSLREFGIIFLFSFFRVDDVEKWNEIIWKTEQFFYSNKIGSRKNVSDNREVGGSLVRAVASTLYIQYFHCYFSAGAWHSFYLIKINLRYDDAEAENAFAPYNQRRQAHSSPSESPDNPAMPVTQCFPKRSRFGGVPATMSFFSFNDLWRLKNFDHINFVSKNHSSSNDFRQSMKC